MDDEIEALAVKFERSQDQGKRIRGRRRTYRHERPIIADLAVRGNNPGKEAARKGETREKDICPWRAGESGNVFHIPPA